MATSWTKEKKQGNQERKEWDESTVSWDDSLINWDGRESAIWTNENQSD